jgi:ABC-type spermidine/putrescine transport system permease subunit I
MSAAVRAGGPSAAFWLLVPALLLYGVVFLWPSGVMLARSVVENDALSAAKLRRARLDPRSTLNVIATTFRFAVVVTALCLVLGYPIAMLMARGSWRTRALLTVAVVVPYWLDYIVRTYSWMVLLGRNGFVNQMLVGLGLVDNPTSFLSSDFAVIVGMVQVMLPLMILSLFAGMTRIDAELLEAASAHGAGGFAAFRTVFLPLSLPGVIAGCLLTFVNTLGFYITPALLGGPKQTMISQSIDVLASKLLDWPLASALSAVLLAATVVVLAAFNRLFGFERLAGGR